MKPKITQSLCLSVFCVASLCVYAQEKHLFILSGQSNMARFGEIIHFTPDVEAEFGSGNVVVVKNAKGGQSIMRWYKGYPASIYPGVVKGDLYDTLMTAVTNRLSTEGLEPSDFTSVSFLWMQGEEDTRIGRANALPYYGEALIGILNQLREDLGRTDINYVIGRISDFGLLNDPGWGPNWQDIRDYQVAVAESDPRFTWVNTDDLNSGLTKNGTMVTNELHYTVEGYALFGERLAGAASELIHSDMNAWWNGWGEELGGFEDDFDSDSQNNLVEFALGGNPSTNDFSSRLPTCSIETNNLLYTFSRRKNSTAVEYAVETSQDLSQWNSFTSDPVDVTSENATNEWVTYSVPVAADQGFVRLTIDADRVRDYQ